tara:strand:+ start:1148 stop:1294 length:147 start_codon:yes stop_codon:yes gene_type:complete
MPKHGIFVLSHSLSSKGRRLVKNWYVFKLRLDNILHQLSDFVVVFQKT